MTNNHPRLTGSFGLGMLSCLMLLNGRIASLQISILLRVGELKAFSPVFGKLASFSADFQGSLSESFP